MEVVAGLADMGHRVSIVTNFSASIEKIDRFLEAAGTALRVFSASLHREYVATEHEETAFIGKARYVMARLPSGASFHVTCVATRANLPVLPELVQRFAAVGIRLKVQPEKQQRDVIAYTAEEQAQILALGGHNGLGMIAPSFQGRPCWAGAYAFTLDDRGDACRYAYCNCTVPIERGMMARS
jgi:hypothetical protein